MAKRNLPTGETKPLEVNIANKRLLLLPEKAIFWEEQEALILSDLHVGKAAHFRKNGVAIPKEANRTIFWDLSHLIQRFKPKQVLIIGDLFHSELNNEWDEFVDFRYNFSEVKFVLVEGNHDTIPKVLLEEADIEWMFRYELDGIQFVHDPKDAIETGFTVCGHIHPAVRLYGAGKQYLRLPCFFKQGDALVLPGFGYFTGTHSMKPQKGDEVWVTTGKEVMKLDL